ncbi:uncharacterized protein [Apostichopus japonicus]|uniref:uncharacterized protein isoform X1 n=1 Tax=Stichopus japonicus TaxID=307972 RepID=UPI003AB4790C
MAQAINQQIVRGNQQPVINGQQQILQTEENNCIRLSRTAMSIVISLCGISLFCPLITSRFLAMINGAIAIIVGSVGVLSGMSYNKYVNTCFRNLAWVAVIMGGVLIFIQFLFWGKDADSFVFVGILACEFTACIVGSYLTYCGVDVNRPYVVPPANEGVVNPAYRPPAKAPTKAPEHRPPTKAIPLPDMFFTA